MRYQVESSDIQNHFNTAKDMLLDKLEALGMLRIPARELKAKYAFVLLERKAMGSFLDKLLFAKDVSPRIQLIETANVLLPDKPGLRIIKNEKEEDRT
jgi:hypothetical protein